MRRRLHAACLRRGLWYEETVPGVFRVTWHRKVKASTETVVEGAIGDVLAAVDRMPLLATSPA
jgi:hypothetical protein